VSALLGVAGCGTLYFCVPPHQDLYFPLTGSPDQLRQTLFQYLRTKHPECILSEEVDSLTVYFPAYEGRKRGLFGFGPTYQESLKVTIILMGGDLGVGPGGRIFSLEFRA
jgi:hypothetical protein